MVKDTSSNPKAPSTATTKPQKAFTDASVLDKRIPKDLLMQYQGKWYVLYAGLLYKAHLLYRGGNWGVTTEIVEKSPDYCLAKATFRTRDGVEYSNYGECTKDNVTNPQMQKYFLHLAVTRAVCRVLRMATASAYVSAEEMQWYGNGGQKEIPVSEDDGKPATTAQIQFILNNGGEVPTDVKQGEAKEIIAKLLEKK